MGSKRVTSIPLSCILLLFLAGFATSDLTKDKAECTNQLLGLAQCLSYVSGQAKAPTIDCCSGLKQVLEKSKKCLCILIKDRNDPNLGLKINATLAIHLPEACHTPANITECIDLLQLKSHSPEAKVFEGFAKATETNSSIPASTGNATADSGKGSVAEGKSDGGWGKRWLVVQVVCEVLPFLFISHIFFLF
ncbi:hypothetical protein L6164_012473 [Bauhinia variegata]|uniref:Uncharacterized protein n=1 Tax=Bauhinia variegata TaxID=167791 RepID=A0ACB9PAH5_BAUVA|nr:hypothetical protein L6164_012473 [Bauhinia variegata]